MINYIMKKYALSRQGAKDLIVATISCVVHNLMLMLPVSLLYFLVSDLYEGGVSQSHLWIRNDRGRFAHFVLVSMGIRGNILCDI